MSEPVGTVLMLDSERGPGVLSAPRYRVCVLAGPDAGKEATAVDGRLTVGTAPGADLRLTERTVSRFHVELEATAAGIVIRDLDSTNGTYLGAVTVHEIVAKDALDFDVGRTRLRLAIGAERTVVPTAEQGSFGPLIGASAPMRAIYSVLERAAPTTAPILIAGESGTGKELAARAAHQASSRAQQSFEVVDCGGLPPTLIESELFGHVRGAFTGASTDHEGAFERANGGTLFLDELGELPLELQPKLLRVLGEGEFRRIGGKSTQRTDVRIIAATNRDLRREVNSGQFRSDLYYRLAVIQIRMPPLRERLEDLREIVSALLEEIGRSRGVQVDVPPDAELLATLAKHSWPGNVRELRNYLENLVILRTPPAFPSDQEAGVGRELGGLLEGIEAAPFELARARFEELYLRRLLEHTGGNVAEAARRASVSRATLFRLIRRHGIRAGEG